MYFNNRWHYSHQDIDVGDLIKSSNKYRRLKLRMRKQIVDRDVRGLWKRSTYHSTGLRQRWGDLFQFKVEVNPVEGVYYKQLTGYVLWRTWYRLEQTPTGGLHARRDPSEELMAVVLRGLPLWRLDPMNPTVTDQVKTEYPEAFGKDVVSLDELLTD